MEKHRENAKNCEQQSRRFSEPLPNRVAGWNNGIRRQAAVQLRVSYVVQHIDHVCAANGLRIIDTGVRESCLLLQLRNACTRDLDHVLLRPEMKTASRTCLDASRFEPLPDAIGTERAFKDFLRLRIELGNVEGTT